MTTGWPTRSRVKAHAHAKADPSADGTAVSARCAATAAPMPWRARAKATKNASPGPEMPGATDPVPLSAIRQAPDAYGKRLGWGYPHREGSQSRPGAFPAGRGRVG